jgi:protein-tyrosine phosphatase
VAYRHITLLDLNIADSRLDELMKSDREPQALDFYGTILENTEGFRKVVHAILETPKDACVLFHCTEGKDRTGILAMLLLSLAGVDRNDCIANYEITRENILRKPYYAHDFAQAGSRQKLMGSDPDTIAVTYDFVMQRYGSAEGYFHACGVSDAAIAALRKRLVVSA